MRLLMLMLKGQNFGTTFNGNKVNIYKSLQDGERFVGLGEALGNPRQERQRCYIKQYRQL
jgi:hypothetical protein